MVRAWLDLVVYCFCCTR